MHRKPFHQAPIKLVAAALISILLISAFPVPPASAAVAVLGQWNATPVITASIGSTQTGIYNVPAGSNRLMVVAVASEYSLPRTQRVSVTYGAQSLTEVIQLTNQYNNIWIGYLNEAGIAAATDTTLSISYNSISLRRINVHAATYGGVDQVNPIADTSLTYIGSGNSLNFGKNVSVVNGGYLFYQTLADVNTVSATHPAAAGYIEHFDQNFNDVFAKSIASKVITSTGTENRTITFSETSRLVLAAVSLNPFINFSPTDITLSNNVVDENQTANTAVGTLSTLDPDAGNTHIYSLASGVAGCDSSGNSSFNINGNQLRTSMPFDYETPPASFNVCIRSTDNGGLAYEKQFTVTVGNVNEPPSNSVPGGQTTDEGTPLVFSAGKANLISINDPDAGSNDLKVALNVTNGSLTLNGTSGLTFTIGDGTDDISMVFAGSQAAINAALDGLTYTPIAGFNASDTLTITTDDQGNTGSGGAQSDNDTVDINVTGVAPEIARNGVKINNDAGEAIAEGETVTAVIARLLVTFNEDMDNTTKGDEVTNVANYLLLQEGSTVGFQTTSCQNVKTGTGVNPGDTHVTIGSVTYDNATYTATLNLTKALPRGIYRLYACGTATLRDLGGNALAGDGANAGTDFIRNFQVLLPPPEEGDPGKKNVSSQAPVTGFAPGRITDLSSLPVTGYHATNGVTLEVPVLKLKLPIVGVPMLNKTWDVNWLLNQAGWLEGTAFPGFDGNSVLTSHVTLSYGQPGPFANLYKLNLGDKIFVHAFGDLHIYEIKSIKKVDSTDPSIFQHEDKSWLTLVTCADYNEKAETYLKRLVVKAKLVETRLDY